MYTLELIFIIKNMKDFSRSLFIDHLIALGPNLDYGLDNNGDNE